VKQTLRYHPLLAALHWLLAVAIVAMLAIGYFWLAPMPNTDPRKIGILMLHMSGGTLIVILMVIRLITRMRTRHPAPATTGHPLLDRIAPLTHYGFYVVVFAMVGSGFSTAIQSGLNQIVFGRTGEPLPASLTEYPAFVTHMVLAAVLAGLILLHVLAAFFHHFIKKDGLLGRMSLRRRAAASLAPAE
jgi:cytochrome b561